MKNQQGAALLMSLIIMLAMTIVGIAAMKGASMEITMAALMQQEEIALRRAERTLLVGEKVIESLIPPYSSFQDGYYNAADNLNSHIADWTNIDTVVNDDLDENDQYVVEDLGVDILDGESIGESTAYNGAIAGGTVQAFRVTARSASGAKGVRLLESIYTKIE